MAKTVLTNRENEVAELKALLDKDAAAIAAANEAMDAATNGGDLKAYQTAKRERQDASDALEMHTARLSALEKKPLISKADYDQAISSVYSEIEQLDTKAKQDLAQLSEQMEKIVTDLQDAISEANRVLQVLQHDVYRDADRRLNNKGDIIMTPSEDKRINKADTISWGRAGVLHSQYARFTGRTVK